MLAVAPRSRNLHNIHFSPQRKQRMKRLTLFKGIIADYSENHTEHKNSLRWQSSGSLKQMVLVVTTWHWWVNDVFHSDFMSAGASKSSERYVATRQKLKAGISRVRADMQQTFLRRHVRSHVSARTTTEIHRSDFSVLNYTTQTWLPLTSISEGTSETISVLSEDEVKTTAKTWVHHQYRELHHD
jgi:hypothetical protein